MGEGGGGDGVGRGVVDYKVPDGRVEMFWDVLLLHRPKLDIRYWSFEWPSPGCCCYNETFVCQPAYHVSASPLERRDLTHSSGTSRICL